MALNKDDIVWRGLESFGCICATSLFRQKWKVLKMKKKKFMVAIAAEMSQYHWIWFQIIVRDKFRKSPQIYM